MIDNHTPWAAAILGVCGRRGEPALCLAVEATFTVTQGRCLPADVQPAIDLDGSWHGDPATSAPRSVPCAPLPKQGTDVVLLGHALAPATFVELRCGPLRQRAELRGDRCWQRTWLGIRPSPPAPWERLPLRWERAAGGPGEPRNPLGCGVVERKAVFREGLALPNLEHPVHPLRRWGDTPPPVGFGWTAPAWVSRQTDDAWNPRAMNAAPPELVAEAGLRGDEPVEVSGVRATGPWSFSLPGVKPPVITVIRADGDLEPEARLDTVAIDADTGTVRLTWRAWTLVGGHELVSAVEVR
jgi:hypothetical protein